MMFDDFADAPMMIAHTTAFREMDMKVTLDDVAKKVPEKP